MHRRCSAMRYDDQEDPKKPQSVMAFRKGDNLLESQERGPRKVGPRGRKDDHRDDHRHVRC